jgi:hypothetical protein
VEFISNFALTGLLRIFCTGEMHTGDEAPLPAKPNQPGKWLLIKQPLAPLAGGLIFCLKCHGDFLPNDQ